MNTKNKAWGKFINSPITDFTDNFRRSQNSGEYDLTRYDRDNPLLAIRQITTGYRKWAERYIAECHGQRVYRTRFKTVG